MPESSRRKLRSLVTKIRTEVKDAPKLKAEGNLSPDVALCWGHLQTSRESKRMSALPPEADIRVTHLMPALGHERTWCRTFLISPSAGSISNRLAL